MVLKMRVRLAKSKRAYTQYISIPADVVRDSQYPFKGNENLNLVVVPDKNLIILSLADITIIHTKEVKETADTITLKIGPREGHGDLKAIAYIQHPETASPEKEDST